MTKICEMCWAQFETTHKEVRFCSKECAGMAHRKLNQEKREAKAKELGVTLEELAKMMRRGRVGLSNQPKHYKYKNRPKTYKQIRAANRAHPIVAGWRGQIVMGGW